MKSWVRLVVIEVLKDLAGFAAEESGVANGIGWVSSEAPARN